MTRRDLLTSGQVGKILGKSARTVTRLAMEGKLAHAERLPVANGVYLFDRDAVEAYQAEHERAKAAR